MFEESAEGSQHDQLQDVEGAEEELVSEGLDDSSVEQTASKGQSTTYSDKNASAHRSHQ
jgi:hypothetical protein